MAEVYNKEQIGDLEVEEKFNKLMQTAVGKDSLYIRAKDTVNDYMESGDLTLRERTEIVSKMIGDMSSSITNNAMSAALQWAKEDRDAPYQMTKLREDTVLVQEQQLKVIADTANVGADAAIKEVQKDNIVIEGWKIQSDMRRDNGIELGTTTTETAVLNNTVYKNYGIKYHQGLQVKGATYVAYAKSYRDAGNVSGTDTMSATGTGTMSSTATGVNAGLIAAQTNVAIRQEIAFDDNKRQHAANSSAAMIGMVVSTENYLALSTTDLARWQDAVDYLNTDTTTTQ